MTTIAELHIDDDPLAWQSIGLDVDAGGTAQVGMVRLRIERAGDGDRQGLVAWTLAGAPSETVTDVDGIPTAHGEPPSLPGLSSNLLGAVAIDHLVMTTPDLDRTIGAIEQRLGLFLRRSREGEAYGRPVRQAFFRMGEVVLEVVGPPEPDPDGGPARLWGLAFTVESLPAAIGFLGGDRVGAAKPATQPGREIATARTAAGLAVPLALMSGEPRL
jgi:hypothetical protein